MKKFISAYSKKNRSQLRCDSPSRTKQNHKNECDIQFILDRFQKTGMINHRELHEHNFGDFPEINYHDAMTEIARANSMFESVPSSIRNKFENDPGKFLEFVNDEKNLDEMIELGLVEAQTPDTGPGSQIDLEDAIAAKTEPSGDPGEPPAKPADS